MLSLATSILTFWFGCVLLRSKQAMQCFAPKGTAVANNLCFFYAPLSFFFRSGNPGPWPPEPIKKMKIRSWRTDTANKTSIRSALLRSKKKQWRCRGQNIKYYGRNPPPIPHNSNKYIYLCVFHIYICLYIYEKLSRVHFRINIYLYLYVLYILYIRRYARILTAIAKNYII